MGTFTGFTGKTSVVSARIEYTGTYVGSRTVEVTLKLYAKRTDWDGSSAATYSASTSSPSSWSEDYSMPTGTTSSVFKNYAELHLLTRTFTVTVNDNGVASVDMFFSVTATSSGTYTVDAHLTSLSFDTPPYTERTLSITTSADGVTVTVNRSKSPNGGGPTGNLKNGDVIYDNDILAITYSAATGYDVATATLNGNDFNSGITITVNGNVSISVTASIKRYTLSIDCGDGLSVVVKRTSSKAGAGLTEVKSGAYIYHFDTLQVTYSAADGYEAKVHTLNGVSFTSGATHTVTKAVTIVVAGGALGLVYIAGEAYQCFIGNGSGWDMHAPYVGEGPDKGFVLHS